MSVSEREPAAPARSRPPQGSSDRDVASGDKPKPVRLVGAWWAPAVGIAGLGLISAIEIEARTDAVLCAWIREQKTLDIIGRQTRRGSMLLPIYAFRSLVEPTGERVRIIRRGSRDDQRPTIALAET